MQLRAIIILTVAILAFAGKVKVWELYLMNTLVAAGFWMFWPTITALIQELTPGEEFVHANTFLLAGIQGGWLIAGSIVGFVYNHIGLGGVLLIDFSTYLVSFLCYFGVRKGRHVVPRPAELRADIVAAESPSSALCGRCAKASIFCAAIAPWSLLGISWALFLGAMMTGVVVTAPLSDQVFHAGAVGYGWLNAGWGTGAFLSALYAPQLIARWGRAARSRFPWDCWRSAMIVAPLSPWLAIAVAIYAIMGSGRGVSGVAMNTSIMEQVPQHFMGRVQNTFYFAGTMLQIVLGFLVGAVAQWNLVGRLLHHRHGLCGGFCHAVWPVATASPVLELDRWIEVAPASRAPLRAGQRPALPVARSRLLCFPFKFHRRLVMSSSLEGRVAVVFGVANKRSIAWSIAQGLHQAGAKLVITYQNERLELEAKDLISSLPGAEGFMCDVSDDAAIERLFAHLKERYGKLHVLVHSVAFAPADELKGEFVATTREGFRIAHDVSVYSLVALARAAAPLMEDGGSIITMTYYGAERVVPRYNVMGVAKAALECSVRYLAYDLGKKKIRVNAISAGPSRPWRRGAFPVLAIC